MYQRFDKVAALQCTSHNFTKTGIHVRSSGRITYNFYVSTAKPPWWKLFFSKVADVEFISTILPKTDSTRETFRHRFGKIALFKILKSFQRAIFANFFLIQLQDFIYTVVCNFTENSMFRIFSIRAKAV